jgi:hypothetical protein
LVSFSGLNSVRDRTIFTNKGPICKKPLPIITGNNLKVLSEVDIEIPTGTFTPSQEGYYLQIVGSLAGRNDGTFTILQVLSPQILRLKGCNFNVVDATQTTAALVLLVNDLKHKYNFHRTQFVSVGSFLVGVHGTNDTTHVVISPDATNLVSSITLLNELRTKFELHRVDQTGDPQVHRNPDDVDEVFSTEASV